METSSDGDCMEVASNDDSSINDPSYQEKSPSIEGGYEISDFNSKVSGDDEPSSPSFCNGRTIVEDVIELDDSYDINSLYDVRLDELTGSTLYVSSVVSKNGALKSHVAYVGVFKNHLEYNTDAFSMSDTKSDVYMEYITSNIFSRAYADIQLDEDALVDASWEIESIDLCNKIKSFLTPYSTECNDVEFDVNDVPIGSGNFRILDCTCGIGGNLVHFSTHFDKSIGIEINKTRADMCKNNLSVYGVDDKAIVINENFLSWADEFLKSPSDYFNSLGITNYSSSEPYPFHWTFISPPWGGKNYKGSNSFKCIYKLINTSPMDIEKTIEYSSKLSQNTTLNLPRSQSLAEIIKLASDNGYPIILVDEYSTSEKHQHIRVCLI